MNKLLFKNKGIQFGALYNNFQQRLKKASNELSYVDYVKITDSEKALRHYGDACFNDFINYQLITTRKSADKDNMIKSLISDEHKYATIINNLQHRIHSSSENQDSNNQKALLSKMSNKAEAYKDRIKHLRQRYASLKNTNADALKAVDQYKQLYEDEKKKAEAKPKVKIVKKPVIKTRTIYKPQPQSKAPQSSQSAEDTSKSHQNSNEGQKSSEFNPFMGPNEMQQQSDEKAQHERAESESDSNSGDSSNADNDVYLRARRRAEQGESDNNSSKHKSSKGDTRNTKHSSASQAPDLTGLRNKSYSLDNNAADRAIQEAKNSVYNSDNNASASDDDPGSSEKSPNSSKSSDSADSEESSSDDSSNDAPTLKM